MGKSWNVQLSRLCQEVAPDCMLGTLRKDSFVVEPLNPERKCTTLSVAAHSLYEKSNPYELPGPGGAIDLHKTTFTQLSESQVEVRGTEFVPTEDYYVKLEGVRRVGYRTIRLQLHMTPL